VNLYKILRERLRHLRGNQIIEQTNYSKSRFYAWLKGIYERKKRDPKLVPMQVAEAAVEVIGKYPHFSASKGQGYMIYHQMGYIPQHIYKSLKKTVRRLIFQEVLNRQLLPERTSYTHERPDGPGEIWAEDFTRIGVSGETFYVSLLIDVASKYYLGATASKWADDKLVEAPVIQALEVTEGCGPKRFLLSDNGSQYISTEHGRLLNKLDIVQKRIPACTPEYNGSIECGVKEFKNVFYNVWAQMETIAADKGKTILERAQLAVCESAKRLNYEIPRPCLRGVTPADVQKGVSEEKIQINHKYVERDQQTKLAKPWTKSRWVLVKDALCLKGLSNLELMTKFCFFLKRPLRKLPNLMPEVLGFKEV
jgi:transposase InsO family protein